MVIRPLARSDSLATLTTLLHRAYARLGAGGLNYTAVDQSADVTRQRVELGECLVAEEGGEIIGTITLKRPGESDGCHWYSKSEVAVFGQFGVHPSSQGIGVGTAMLRAVESMASRLGAGELALDTAEDATQLVAWYVRQGYRPVEHVQWDGKTYRSVILSKRL